MEHLGSAFVNKFYNLGKTHNKIGNQFSVQNTKLPPPL